MVNFHLLHDGLQLCKLINSIYQDIELRGDSNKTNLQENGGNSRQFFFKIIPSLQKHPYVFPISEVWVAQDTSPSISSCHQVLLILHSEILSNPCAFLISSATIFILNTIISCLRNLNSRPLHQAGLLTSTLTCLKPILHPQQA